MDELGIAESVVIRHTCHCKTATEQPGEDEVTEHAFLVDGEEFPWYISEHGQTVTRLADDFYTIQVDILLLDKETKETLEFSYWPRGRSKGGLTVPYVPIIGGVKFPWTCTDDQFVLRFSHKMLPTLRLAFFARDVDAKGIEVADKRPKWVDRALYRAGGDLVKTGKDECFWCGELADDVLEHIQETHPERCRGSKVMVSG